MPTRSRPRMTVRFFRSQSATANWPRVFSKNPSPRSSYRWAHSSVSHRVASRWPRASNSRLQLGVLEDLAVLGDPDRAVLIADRLPAARQVDDRQPSCPQRNPRLLMNLLVIGPAVRDRTSHRQQPAGGKLADRSDRSPRQCRTWSFGPSQNEWLGSARHHSPSYTDQPSAAAFRFLM